MQSMVSVRILFVISFLFAITHASNSWQRPQRNDESSVADAVKYLQELDNYYSHLSRPRYGIENTHAFWLFGRGLYICAASIDHSNSLTNSFTFTGTETHLDGKSDSDIEYLTIVKSYLTRIPPDIGEQLPKLIALDLTAEETNTITAEDLKQFPKIQLLHIYHTPIVSLDADLFKYTPHIKSLSIHNCSIAHVGEGLLTNLVDLQRMFFRDNTCLSYEANSLTMLEWLKENIYIKCPPLRSSSPDQPSTVSPDDNCPIRCSINVEIDELKIQLMQQGELIRGLNDISSDYSHRIFELENIIDRMTKAVCSQKI